MGVIVESFILLESSHFCFLCDLCWIDVEVTVVFDACAGSQGAFNYGDEVEVRVGGIRRVEFRSDLILVVGPRCEH